MTFGDLCRSDMRQKHSKTTRSVDDDNVTTSSHVLFLPRFDGRETLYFILNSNLLPRGRELRVILPGPAATPCVSTEKVPENIARVCSRVLNDHGPRFGEPRQRFSRSVGELNLLFARKRVSTTSGANKFRYSQWRPGQVADWAPF